MVYTTTTDERVSPCLQSPHAVAPSTAVYTRQKAHRCVPLGVMQQILARRGYVHLHFGAIFNFSIFQYSNFSVFNVQYSILNIQFPSLNF